MGDYGRYSWANYIKTRIPAGAVLGTGNLGRKWGHPRGRDGDSYLRATGRRRFGASD